LVEPATGLTQEYIQGLMGHADVQMTEHYQTGRGDDALIYMKVKADLKVQRGGRLPKIFPNPRQQKRAHLSVSPSRPPSRADFVW
jgi:hypothetical protein